MPHLIFKGIKKEDVVSIEKDLIQVLSLIIDCPVDHFTVEWQETMFISGGLENTGGYPFITIHWFNRPEHQEQAVASHLTKIIKLKGYSDVCVYFNDLIPEKYYENGVSF